MLLHINPNAKTNKKLLQSYTPCLDSQSVKIIAQSGAHKIDLQAMFISGAH